MNCGWYAPTEGCVERLHWGGLPIRPDNLGPERRGCNCRQHDDDDDDSTCSHDLVTYRLAVSLMMINLLLLLLLFIPCGSFCTYLCVPPVCDPHD